MSRLYAGFSGMISSRSNWRLSWTVESGFLISWARPPVSVPSSASRSAWRGGGSEVSSPRGREEAAGGAPPHPPNYPLNTPPPHGILGGGGGREGVCVLVV